jgi:galactokinase
MTSDIDSLAALFQQRFGQPPAAVGRAPGRIEFLGNHTDYNGGAVIGAAINREVRVAVAPSREPRLRLASRGGEDLELPLREIRKQAGAASWANYPLGVLDQLRRRGFPADQSFDLLIASSLPSGAGMSSSAALEMATIEALCAAFDFPVEQVEKVRMARAAENEFVGVPCGILDQGVSAFGKKDGLVYIDCAEECFSPLTIPANTQFWIFNSNQKHSLVDSLYAQRYAECQAAAHSLGLEGKGGHLCHCEPVTIEAARTLLGEDSARRALHVTREHRRVLKARELLSAGDITGVGSLLWCSHESSRDLFENSIPELDLLVELLREHPGVLGARLTGGGFGGAVMAWTTTDFSNEAAESVALAYARQFHARPNVLEVTAAEGAGLAVID